MQAESKKEIALEMTFARAVHEIKSSDNVVVSPKGFCMPIYTALTYAGLGEKEKALEQAHRTVGAPRSYSYTA
jgi:hypothetical protein